MREFFRAGYTVGLFNKTDQPAWHTFAFQKQKSKNSSSESQVVRISNTKQMYGYSCLLLFSENVWTFNDTDGSGIEVKSDSQYANFVVCCVDAMMRTGFGKNNGVIQVCMLNAILIDEIFAFTGLYSILKWWCELDLP